MTITATSFCEQEKRKLVADPRVVDSAVVESVVTGGSVGGWTVGGLGVVVASGVG